MIDFYTEVLRRKDEFIKLLGEWIAIPSVYDTATVSDEMPFGEGVGRALEWFEKLGERDGFVVENKEGYAVHVEYGKGDEYVCAFGHCDVVSPGEGWNTPPFELNLVDGKVFGRGVVDDKGPILGCYMGLKIIKDLNLPVKNRIRVIVGGNEENGFKCIRKYFKEEAQPRFGFTPDAKFPVIHGEKGGAVLAIEGRIDNDELEIVSGGAHNMIPSIIELKLGNKYEFLRGEFKRFLFENNLSGEFLSSDEGISIKLQGKGGHSSKPEISVNPITKLAKFMSANLQERWAKDLGRILIDEDYSGAGFGINISGKCGSMTIVPTVLKASEGKVSVLYSVRYPENADRDFIEGKIKKYIGEKLDCKYRFGLEFLKRPSYVDPDFILVKRLHNIYISQTGDRESKVRLTSAGTYASEMKNSVVFGAEFGDESSGNVHGANEYIEADRLLLAVSIYAEALYEMANM